MMAGRRHHPPPMPQRAVHPTRPRSMRVRRPSHPLRQTDAGLHVHRAAQPPPNLMPHSHRQAPSLHRLTLSQIHGRGGLNPHSAPRQEPTTAPHPPPAHHQTQPQTGAPGGPHPLRAQRQEPTTVPHPHPGSPPHQRTHPGTHVRGGPHPHRPLQRPTATHPAHPPPHPQIRADGGRLPHPARRQQATAAPHPPPTHHQLHPQIRAHGGPHPRPAPRQQPTHPSLSQRWAAMHSARRQPTTTRLPQAASPPHHRTHAQSGAHGQPHGRSAAQPLRRAKPAWGDAPPTHAPVPILIPTRIHRRARVREP
jgi:hypothetical protein